MSNDRDNKNDPGNENNSTPNNGASNHEHPNNPFKEPVSATNEQETTEEAAANEQKFKEALTERD